MSAPRRFDNTCKYKNLEVANGYNDIQQYNSVRCKNVTDATLRPHKNRLFTPTQKRGGAIE